ncbi:DNA-binding protein [Kitasatospora cineracea]|uniref:DNA-binding protein n=1 Tax=Kitasatospora cineracea TaxID=88074 RepID=UPI0034039D59
MSERFATVVLDSQGLSAWVAQDRRPFVKPDLFVSVGAELVTCANTIVEVIHARVNRARLNWVLSRGRVGSVTEPAAEAAADLLVEAGLHGHAYALDATVAGTALRQPGPVAVLTSDVDGMAKLRGSRIRLVAI